MSDCEGYLGTLSKMGFAVGDFYLLLGRAFQAQALPPGYAKGEPRACYRNAAELAMRDPALTYCEGYARPQNLIPVHHAWCVTADGSVVDPTWPHCATAQYFGLALDTTWLLTKLAQDGMWGLLAEHIPRGWLDLPVTTYLAQGFLPDKAKLSEFEAKRKGWLQPA